MTNRGVGRIDMNIISTHTPHTRHDNRWKQTAGNMYQFLLTRLIRGMTLPQMHRPRQLLISTHTPHTRHDSFPRKSRTRYSKFLLTRLIRGMTDCDGFGMKNFFISTHTPHTRHDRRVSLGTLAQTHFYSHASYEA